MISYSDSALAIAATVTGKTPAIVTRFTTGTRHYVYEVTFAEAPSVVVRIGDETAHAEMAGAVYLSRLLKPRGAPLPTLLGDDVNAELPWMVMERLLGVDLGDKMASLSYTKLNLIAEKVVTAQTIVAGTGSANKYGYAIQPDLAPFDSWSEVLFANLERSRARILKAGLFDTVLIDRLKVLLVEARPQLDDIAATPFLHDTTTKNVIIDPDGNFSGIVDVDDLCFGDPRYPAALTLSVLLGYGGPTQYVSFWMHHAGHADDESFRLYVALFLLDLMAEHGQVFNGNQRPSTSDKRAQLLRAFEANLISVR